MLFSLFAHLLCLALAGAALWRLWRMAVPISRLLAGVIAAGFVLRSIAAQFLFWVSYLEIPLARSLQLGDGFWFFGLDGRFYMKAAVRAADDGMGAILALSPSLPSVFYIKVLALFIWLFGAVVSTALLLNLATYLATGLVIVMWGARRRVDPRITAVPLVAISFLPSAILWSLQPLKDGLVCFLAVLFAFALDSFSGAWTSDRGRVRASRVVLIMVLLCACLYAIAGIRWYYAVILLTAATIPLVATMGARRGSRDGLFVRGVVILFVIVLLSQQVVAGAGPYLPDGIRDILRPWRSRASVTTRFSRVGAVITSARDNFDRYRSAGTRIRAGDVIADNERLRARSNPSPPVASASKPTGTTAVAPVHPQPAVAPAPRPVKRTETTTVVPAHPQPAVVPAPRPVKRTGTTTVVPVHPQPAVAPAPRPVKRTETTTVVPVPPQPAVAPTPLPVKRHVSHPSRAEKNPVATRPLAKNPPKRRPSKSAAADVPTTDAGRLTSGLAALLLPREIAAALGLVSIGGGRGLWWFVDIDTILFNILMLCSLALLVSGLRRGAWRDPFVWYLIVATVVMAASLAYTVSNYGTLFRHRQMVVTTLALIGLAAARPRSPVVDGAHQPPTSTA